MRTRKKKTIPNELAEPLRAVGSGAPPIQQKLEMVQAFRDEAADHGPPLDQFLVCEMEAARRGLVEADATLQKVGKKLAEYEAQPWHTATYLGPADIEDGGPAAGRHVVGDSQQQRLVTCHSDLDAATLRRGDTVILGPDQNVIMARSPVDRFGRGDTATFAGFLDADRSRVRVRHQDQTIVLHASDRLREDEQIEEGDLVRFDRSLFLGLERVPAGDDREFVLDTVPDIRPNEVGGLDETYDRIVRALMMRIAYPDKAQRYGLLTGVPPTVLLYGPSGCGKTLLAKAATAATQRATGRQTRFSVVRPGEFENPYVGVTQQRIRRCFAELKKAENAVLFLDEIENVGRQRGGFNGVHNDKFLAALLAELDGFEGRGGTVVIAATNVREMLDPALLGRFRTQIEVPRPNLPAAEAILRIHLDRDMPVSPNGDLAGQTREQIVQRALDRIYHPNDPAAELCVVGLRDGKRRTVRASEIISGRLLADVAYQAREAAFARDLSDGGEGVRVEDIDAAIDEAFRQVAGGLSPFNLRAHVSGLPQDVDVVSVQPIRRRVTRPHRYLNLELAAAGRFGEDS